MANAIIAHYGGNELTTSSDNTDIQTVKTMIPSLGMALWGVWADLAPLDLDVTINLTTGSSKSN